MCARAHCHGIDGIMAVLSEIQKYGEMERANLSVEPFLTEQIVRHHLPNIAKMQVCPSLCIYPFTLKH